MDDSAIGASQQHQGRWLELIVDVVPGDDVVSIRGEVTRIDVGPGHEPGPLFRRQLALAGDGKAPVTFRLPLPAGAHKALTLGLDQLRFTTGGGSTKAVFLARAESTFAIDIPDGAQGSRLRIKVALAALLRAEEPADFISIHQDTTVLERRFTIAAPSRGHTLRLGQAAVAVPAGAFLKGGRLLLREPAPDALPPLLPNQRRVGPPLEVRTDDVFTGMAEITVAYNPALLAAAGVAPDQAVVVQLDDGRTLYREWRPLRVDPRAATLTVRVPSFSTFFACTPGLEVQSPRLSVDGFGQLLGFSPGPDITVAVRAADPDAQVFLRHPQAPVRWRHRELSVFEAVPLDPAVTDVELEVQAEGLLPHTCAFQIRSAIVPRRITNPRRPFGPALAITDSDRPHVSATVASTRFFSDHLLPSLERWQRSLERLAPFLYWPDDSRTGWAWQPLLPETHFENEAVAMALRLLQNTLPAPLVVPIAEDAPPGRRYLDALSGFLVDLPATDLRRASIDRALDLARALFGPDTLSVSPRSPLLALGGERVGTAFVAATFTATNPALASGLHPILRDLYGPLTRRPEERPSPRAGRLFWVEGVRNGSLEREIVAEGIWCASVAVARDPLSGDPVIAALGVAADRTVERNGQMVREPRSRLLLFRRRPEGGWQEEVVLDDRPLIQVDLAIDSAGDSRLVATVAAAELIIKPHVVTIRRDGPGWQAQPLVFTVDTAGGARRADRGIWPRIVVDGRGRSVIVVCEWQALWRWHVVVEENGSWRARLLRQARWLDLSGSPLPRGTLTIDEPASPSGLSLAHWAADVVLAAPDTLWCAYGDGMLRFARLQLDTLALEEETLAVDRATGFFPALAARAIGAPAFVFKDPHGQEGLDASSDDLFFLSTDEGGVVPGWTGGGGASRFGPLLPPYSQASLSLFGFGGHLPLNCGVIRDVSQLPRLLASVIMDRRFHLELFPREGDYPFWRLDFRRSHPQLARLIEGLQERPAVLTFEIDNGDFPDEDIERVVVTSFPDPVARIPPALAAPLDSGVVSPDLVAAFADRRLTLNPDRLELTTIVPGAAWDLLDRESSGAGLMVFPQLYHLRRNGDDLEIHLPAVLSLVPRPPASASEVPTDELGRPRVCELDQETWDGFAGPFVQRFQGLPLQLPENAPGTVMHVSARNIHLSRFAPHDPPGSDQQGGMRFTLELPSFAIRNEEPDADIYTIDPSYLYVAVSPCVVNSRLSWWVREAEFRIGNLEVDVAAGVVDWLRFLSIIPGFGFLLALADPFVDGYATSTITRQLVPPSTASFQSLFRDVLNDWVNLELAAAPPIESVLLRGGRLQLWSRAAVSDPPPVSALGLLPEAGLSFGAVVAGQRVERRLLLISTGGLPVLIEQVRLSGGASELTLAEPFLGPLLLNSGASHGLLIAFAPRGPAGFRAADLEVVFNGGQRMVVPLRGIAAEPPRPSIRLRPTRLSFGVVVVGQRREEIIEVWNDGLTQLAFAPPLLEGDPLDVAAFSVLPASGVVPPGQSTLLRVSYAPPVGGPPRHDARLVVESNDPVEPRVDLPVVGFASGLGSVLVQPLVVTFNPTVIEANQSPLPPGLPPTIHAGSTRTVTIYNLGPGPLTVLASTFAILLADGSPSPHVRLWRVDGSPAVPVDVLLQGGQSFTLVLEFLPITVGDHAATLRIQTSDAQQSEIPVPLSGVGVE